MSLQLPLKAVLHVLRNEVARVERWQPDPLLARARLCDAFRDLGVQIPTPQELDHALAEMDTPAWRRLYLVTFAAEDRAVGEALTVAHRFDANPRDFWKEAFVGFAQSMDLHPIALLRESNHRLEELTRTWLLRVGVGITGETPEQSLARLERIDYARLLAEVGRARTAADERLAYLRKLQEKADRLRAPRGKW